jgi:hypothetical protein
LACSLIVGIAWGAWSLLRLHARSHVLQLGDIVQHVALGDPHCCPTSRGCRSGYSLNSPRPCCDRGVSNRIPAHIHGVCFNDNHCSLSENRTRMPLKEPVVNGIGCRQLFERGLSHTGLPLKRKFRPRCCAKTRAGAPCIMRVVPGKRRCRFHGGMSTGPK